MGDDCAGTSPVIPHPSFHHHHHINITITSPHWEILPTLWLWLQAALTKKFKNTKKRIPTVLYVH
jgi:hypothetical protein